jgi:hypothetical protein
MGFTPEAERSVVWINSSNIGTFVTLLLVASLLGCGNLLGRPITYDSLPFRSPNEKLQDQTANLIRLDGCLLEKVRDASVTADSVEYRKQGKHAVSLPELARIELVKNRSRKIGFVVGAVPGVVRMGEGRDDCLSYLTAMRAKACLDEAVLPLTAPNPLEAIVILEIRTSGVIGTAYMTPTALP